MVPLEPPSEVTTLPPEPNVLSRAPEGVRRTSAKTLEDSPAATMLPDESIPTA